MTSTRPASWDDTVAIERLLHNWGLWRDTGRWDDLRNTFAPDARIQTTWFNGQAVDFVQASMAAADRASLVLHVMGPSAVEVRGDRAVAETRVTLLVRDRLQGEEVDVTCYGRFIDRLVRLDNRWAILQRVPIYEKDCMAPVRPGAALALDQAALDRLPAGYRHLAYLQSSAGAHIQLDIPGHNSTEQHGLYASGAQWLRGA